jgi:GNAT superfamily N-acetyltransferase
VSDPRAELRPGRDADSAAFIDVITSCWAEYPGCVVDVDGETPELRALATYCANRGGAVWAAEADGKVVGLVCVYPRDDGAWELAKMYVVREHRGSGLANDLVEAAENFARTHGGKRIKLWSDTRFDRAHRFYEKRSYVRSGPLRALNDKSHSVEFAYAKPLTGVVVERLDAAGAASAEAPLARILVACVDAGASVSFFAPLAMQVARDFWRKAASDVARGEKILLAAWLNGDMVGTVQLDLATPENQPHRAALAKMLVHPVARRHGIARTLLTRAEAEAPTAGRRLLTLDTQEGGEAEALYRSTGWTEVGRIPGYALFADGSPCHTVLFYRELGPPERTAPAPQ